MKKIFISILLSVSAIQTSNAQWAANAVHIYNTNAGNVGIGTSAPSTNPNYTVLSINNSVTGGFGGLVDFKRNEITKSLIAGDDGALTLWTNAGIPIRFWTDNGTEKMTITPNGNIGMGFSMPRARLEVAPPAAGGPAALLRLNGGQAWGHVLTLSTDNPAADDARLLFSYRGGAKNWALGGQANTSRFSIWEDSGDGVFSSGFGTERFTMVPGGNVGIGTSDPGSYKLAVAGNIRASEVKVEALPWPDYVFKDDYRLRSLDEVKSFIDKYYHLPEMPSEKEVVENGLSLGEISRLLTKKVEELTLYLIEQDRKIVTLQKQLDKFESQ